MTEYATLVETTLRRGDFLFLVGEDQVKVEIVDPFDNTVNLFVGDEVVVKAVSLATATNIAKRIVNPDYSPNTGFVSARSWEDEDGTRLSNLVPGNTQRKRVRSVGPKGEEFATQVTLEICDTHFIQKDALGVCFYCD